MREDGVQFLALSARGRIVAEALRAHGLLVVALKIVADEGADVDRVFGEDRHPVSSRTRHRIWAVVYWTLDLSLPALGAIFRRDHTTILHGIRKHQYRLEAPDVPFKAYLDTLRRGRPTLAKAVA